MSGVDGDSSVAEVACVNLGGRVAQPDFDGAQSESDLNTSSVEPITQEETTEDEVVKDEGEAECEEEAVGVGEGEEEVEGEGEKEEVVEGEKEEEEDAEEDEDVEVEDVEEDKEEEGAKEDEEEDAEREDKDEEEDEGVIFSTSVGSDLLCDDVSGESSWISKDIYSRVGIVVKKPCVSIIDLYCRFC